MRRVGTTDCVYPRELNPHFALELLGPVSSGLAQTLVRLTLPEGQLIAKAPVRPTGPARSQSIRAVEAAGFFPDTGESEEVPP